MKQETEEAKRLVEKYIHEIDGGCGKLNCKSVIFYNAKQCALICVDEIIKEVSKWKTSYMGREQLNYWQRVKEAINKL